MPSSGWELSFTRFNGQQATNAWDAHVLPSSGAVTASNVSRTGQITAGQASFGFEGTYGGASAQPSGFSLNGTARSTAYPMPTRSGSAGFLDTSRRAPERALGTHGERPLVHAGRRGKGDVTAIASSTSPLLSTPGPRPDGKSDGNLFASGGH
ncbi:cellulose binding domain-containing protein [Streptomyces sp. NPDC002763]|uniref:cellulose binding domain-containing protein n=1 Tax=Streptomyces sp. NPDC002763 TaxID=3154427 RepID=UPI003316C08B